MKIWKPIAILLFSALLLAGCGEGETSPEETAPDTNSVTVEGADLESEVEAVTEEAALPQIWEEPSAPGTAETRNDLAVVDYSNSADGYIMVQYTAATQQRLKAQVAGPTTTYTYNLTQGVWAPFPLSDGNGEYKVTVYENVTGTKYSAALSATFPVSLTDEFAPFVHSNQYVDFAAAPNSNAKAAELVAGLDNSLDKVAAVYDFVVTTVVYDKDKASSVQSGYLPVLDQVLAEKTGICFDYAALMTGMLRSQGVPCKLVVGYAGQAYHAWISVWTEETGWVDNAIFFDGTAWHRMDPTFASSGDQSESIMAYIGDGANYSAKYFY